MKLKIWIERFKNDDFAKLENERDDVRKQIEAGWFDWFCEDGELADKTESIGQIIVQLKPTGKVNFNDWYVWFKNNCPINGPLYDDFRFARLDNGEVQFTIQIKCCWNRYQFAVFGRTPDGVGHWEKPIFECEETKDLVEWFNTPWDSDRKKWF